MSETPSCSLPLDALARRKEELRRGFATRIVAARELPNGIALGFEPGPDTDAEVEAFVAFESDCCGFADYQVHSDPQGERLWLQIRGAGVLMRALVPPTVAIEPLEAAPGWRRPLRWGAGGAASAITLLICCATPLLPVLLGALGLAAALPWLAPWLDGAALVLLVAACVPLGWALHRRARAAQVGSARGR